MVMSSLKLTAKRDPPVLTDFARRYGVNVVVGYALAVWVQVVAFPLFGLEATLR